MSHQPRATNLLITGGAGFIGSAFVRLLSTKKLNCAIIDKLTYAGSLERIKEAKGKFSFYKTDISNRKNTEEIFKKEKPEIVVHFAAETHVDRSINNPSAFIKTNIEGTHNLLGLALKYKIKRFIHISTDEVYGHINKNSSRKFKETDALLPNSPYSASKASADLLVRSYIKTYGLPAVIIRPCNNYGPWQYPEKLIPTILTNIFLNKKIPVYGDGKNVREWLYVEDCAKMIYKIARKKNLEKNIYNLGSGYRTTNINLVEKILDIERKPRDLIKYVQDRPGHDFMYALNTSLLGNEFGVKPSGRESFEKNIKKTIRWFKSNQKWWRKRLFNSYKLFQNQSPK